MNRAHSLEAAVVVGGRAEHDGLDEERLVAVAFLVAPDDAEAPAARVAAPQHDLVAAVQVAARSADQRHAPAGFALEKVPVLTWGGPTT